MRDPSPRSFWKRFAASIGLRGRIIAIVSGIMVIALGVVVASSAIIFTREYERALQSRSMAIAKSLEVQLERLLSEGLSINAVTGFDEQCVAVARSYRGISDAMVVLTDGIILFDNKPEEKGRNVDPELLSTIQNGGEEIVAHYEGGIFEYSAVVPVETPDGTRVAAVVVDFQGGLISRRIERMVGIGVGIALIVLVCGVAIMVMAISIYVTRPLGQFIQAIEQMSKPGRKIVGHVDVRSADEIGQLGRAFNDMAGRLEGAVENERKVAAAYAAAGERSARLAELAKLARTDALTGLANRRVFVEEIDQAIRRVLWGGRPFAVLSIDLDHFKDVNDTLGYPVGDQLLQAVAQRFAAHIRRSDTLARFGGDEFAVLQSEISEPGDAATLATKLLESMNEQFLLGSGKVRCGASIGITVFEPGSPDAETMMSHADVALYKAKAEGRGTFRFFTETMDAEVRSRVTLTAELHDALDAGQLFVVYEPQVEIKTGHITGFEALVRWRHPVHGVLMPDRFIGIAEKSGLIGWLGRFVLLEASGRAQGWQGRIGQPPIVAVNVSPVQFKAPVELEEAIDGALQATGLPPPRLEIELTETALMERSERHLELLQRLHARGIGLAIDDFGTGYSSLDYLRRLPITRIKVAQAFVARLANTPKDERDVAIIRAIIRLGQDLNIDVLAEGVETIDQLKLIRSLGCNHAQGFIFSRPVPAEGVQRLLTTPMVTV